MFWLGLIVAVCYVPGYTGAFLPTQWAVLSIILPLGLWRSGVFGLGHWIGLGVLGWSALSILWAPNSLDAANGLWFLSILAGAFWLGSTIDPAPVFRGLAVGLTISSAVAIAQSLGYHPVEIAASPTYPAGLLFNSTVLGASVALTILGLCAYRLWWYIPGLLPALALSHSRGAVIILACVGLAMMIRWYAVVGILIIGLGIVSLNPTPSDIQRFYLWGLTIRELTPFGHGIGSFNTFLYYNPTDLYPNAQGFFHPEFVHNDYLQLWFELGAGAIGIYLLYAICLSQTQSPHWPIFFGFALLGLIYFPLYNPIPAFIGSLVAGRIIADWHLARPRLLPRRLTRLLWPQHRQRILDQLRRSSIPS